MTRQNEALTAEREALRRHNAEMEEKLVEAEEDPAAARTSLRRVIPSENADPAIRSEPELLNRRGHVAPTWFEDERAGRLSVPYGTLPP